jgi:hypothetical protein
MVTQPTARPEEMLNNLFMSVQRAGPVFTGNATMTPDGEGFRITMQLAPGAFNHNDVGVRTQKALSVYIREYLRASGWRVRTARVRSSYFELVTAPSRTRSSSSRNL